MPIGVDYGGTKIEAIAIAPDGQELSRRRIATPRHDYAGSLTAIARIVAEVKELSGLHAEPVGIGIPGAVGADGKVFNGNSTWLIGRELASDLQGLMGCVVRVANDANCFVLSEAIDGAGRGAKIVFGAILGTGVGGGLVIDGNMVEGASGIRASGAIRRCPLAMSRNFPALNVSVVGADVWSSGCLDRGWKRIMRATAQSRSVRARACRKSSPLRKRERRRPSRLFCATVADLPAPWPAWSTCWTLT